MFNSSLKKEALKIHEDTLNGYNQSYEKMGKSCERLYGVRCKSVELIKLIQKVVNSIANTPKEFNTELGKVGKELTKFNETEEYAKEAYNASVKAGANIVGGAAAGLGVASMAPTALMSIATTFGTASTGTAISALFLTVIILNLVRILIRPLLIMEMYSRGQPIKLLRMKKKT